MYLYSCQDQEHLQNLTELFKPSQLGQATNFVRILFYNTGQYIKKELRKYFDWCNKSLEDKNSSRRQITKPINSNFNLVNHYDETKA